MTDEKAANENAEPAQENSQTPDAEADGAPEAEAADGAGEVEALQAEAADLKDKLLRMAAELENTRRRADREKADAARYGAANFARDMLAIGDNLRRAIEAVPEEERAGAATIIEGIEMTERALLSAFERHGIKQIAPEAGEKFDAHFHEAMYEVPNTGLPSGSVVQVVETGYMIGDRLLRAARVGVAKGDPAGNGDGNGGGKVDTTV